jgi:DNA-binding NarL/FixJ family response regulator
MVLKLTYISPPPPTTKKDRKKSRILIVDDDPGVTNSFALCLEDAGLFEVRTLNDSADALSNFKSNSYDLVLLDIEMPKVSGLQLYEKIKELDRKVRVCFLSDLDHNSLREQFPSLDVSCIYSKDIQIKELVERIEKELLR